MIALRVLIVEDNSMLAFEMQDILSDAGYEVVGPAATVAKALHLIDSQPPHAAFVDYNLKGEYATEVVRALAARTIPFMVVTGSDPESLPGAFKDVAFARKPFNAAGLIELAQALLERNSPSVQPPS